MNLLLSFLAVAVLWGAGVRWRTGPAHHVRIGAFYYDVTLQTDYQHDNNPDDTYFLITGANSRRAQCAGTRLLVTHQGVVLSKGKYGVDGSRLLLVERLYNPGRIQGESVPDSLLRTFSPDRTGELRLIAYWAYWAGKGKKIRLRDNH